MITRKIAYQPITQYLLAGNSIGNLPIKIGGHYEVSYGDVGFSNKPLIIKNDALGHSYTVDKGIIILPNGTVLRNDKQFTFNTLDYGSQYDNDYLITFLRITKDNSSPNLLFTDPYGIEREHKKYKYLALGNRANTPITYPVMPYLKVHKSGTYINANFMAPYDGLTDEWLLKPWYHYWLCGQRMVSGIMGMDNSNTGWYDVLRLDTMPINTLLRVKKHETNQLFRFTYSKYESWNITWILINNSSSAGATTGYGVVQPIGVNPKYY